MSKVKATGSKALKELDTDGDGTIDIEEMTSAGSIVMETMQYVVDVLLAPTIVVCVRARARLCSGSGRAVRHKRARATAALKAHISRADSVASAVWAVPLPAAVQRYHLLRNIPFHRPRPKKLVSAT